MDFTLFTAEAVPFLMRWVHLLAGIMWIGLLYYFNFVQVPFFAETEAPVRTGAISKLVPRALWWFRWGAMFTFLSGLVIILHRTIGPGGSMSMLGTSWGITIQLGALLGTVMFLNVWLVIWPNQKIVIASTLAVAGGGQADPKAAPAGARAFLASRTNTLLSVPMLFFMAAASHLPLSIKPEANKMVPIAIILAITSAIEANALMGKKGEGAAKMLDKHITVIHVGVVLALVFYFVLDGLL